jgi:hypothetical protein
MTARDIRHPHPGLKALRNNTGLHVIRPAPVAPCTTDDLYLPVETICNIRHRRLLLMNQNETLSSAVTAKEGYPMGCRRRLPLIETCKLNGIDPEAYLRSILSSIADHPINRIAELLPWTWAAHKQSKAA